MPEQNNIQETDTVVSLRRASGHRKKSAAAYRRVAVKQENVVGKGGRLLDVVNMAMAKNNHGIEEVASFLGVSSVYLRAIGKGEHSFAKVDRDVLRKVAEYVKLPVAQVFLLSDTLIATDFFYPDTIEAELERAHESMITDLVWCGYAPSRKEWADMPLRQRIFSALLYEQATGQLFLRSAEIEAA